MGRAVYFTIFAVRALALRNGSPDENDCLTTMQIRVGDELIDDCPQETPMVLM
jgi:hypothetical protein